MKESICEEIITNNKLDSHIDDLRKRLKGKERNRVVTYFYKRYDIIDVGVWDENTFIVNWCEQYYKKVIPRRITYGWFGRVVKEEKFKPEWKWDSDADSMTMREEYIAIIDYVLDTITVYDKDFYDFFQKWGKKNKYKHLYKCWQGVINDNI